MTAFYRFGVGCCRVFCNFMYHIEYRGVENLPKEGGYIVASNHITNLDPLFIGIHLKRMLHFMAKIELFKNPIAARVLRGLGAFPVSRGTGDNTALETAVQVVKNGSILAIFPEGTRSKDGTLRRLKSGAVYVASETGANVVPAIVYLKDFSKGLHFGCHVVITYGKIIENEEIRVHKGERASVHRANERLRASMQTLLEGCQE